ncbi:MAG: NADH-quinone oxidoreductase subunit C [Planctomycetota bacterium]|jgi:NADH-quinone oxidoreductase subunit C|nr:NADH-quinone oxidoreductase subunit C [Planctomycetota bacterium]MDP6988066.1 NADH-quinone oxidoreductase subunit C [Planctomycetota bacterium]
MDAVALIALVSERVPQAVASSHAWRGDTTLILRRAHLLETARLLRDEPELAMNLLVDLSAVDYSTHGESPVPAFFSSSGVSVRGSCLIPDEDPWPGPPLNAHFAVVYHFYSTTLKHRARLVVPLATEDEEVDTLCELWPAANWLERETWDMFGIRFRGHPDLRRLLTYEEFEGHPLRKDYPVNERQPLIGPKN